MTPKIISVKIGFSNSILIVNGSNSVLIDTGVKGHLQQFKTLFEQNRLQPEDIKLIVLTHTHYDHTGNLNELVKLTGAKVLVHKNEFENLKNGFIQIPMGTRFYTKIVVFLGRLLKPRYASPTPFIADITNTDKFMLSEYGIEGTVLHTPGHTTGSQSVLIGKNIFVGDTFFNIREKIVFPPFANNPKQVLKTWENILKLDIEEIYPAHGKSFKVEKAIVEFEKWKKLI
ncbi:MAG: MBL fold metallo-hydrolase [Draconibacterium sp.]|nr:MBL fold metallo-hydrolase [Draconibacterium sp.]